MGPSSASEISDILILQRSGLFDGAWFIKRNPDLVLSGADPLRHFYRWGWRENRQPNAYFAPFWYLDQNPAVRQAGINPLLHYICEGERQGLQPIEHFDPVSYRARYAVPPSTLCLAHFLEHRFKGEVSPLPEFDAEFYLERYPDVRDAGMDPFEHYLVQGAFEDREPSHGFGAQRYRSRHLAGQPNVNPLLHLRAVRRNGGVPDRAGITIPAQVRINSKPGPHFELAAPLPAGTRAAAMLLAFYLPQFHPVPENDAFWGAGFTEWTNLARALPRYAGHYQPRIPRDLGYYNLQDGGVLRRQAGMARDAGIHGFVFYFYWFNRTRVLDSPLEQLLRDPSIELPFCLMWANENWTRRWDGSDDEVLLSQDNDPADEPALVAEFVRHFRDSRYIRLQGRPVLMIYRASLLTDGSANRWRLLFAAHGENPVLVMAQSFADRDPRAFGMEAAVEFPPHKLTVGLPLMNDDLVLLDPEMTANVHAYDDLASASDLSPQPFPLIRTALPNWDNDPRRQGAGMILHGATPAAYQAWLQRLVASARQQRVFGQAIVCINAWNEWGEGAYLEPDVHFGAAFLNATARAVTQGKQARVRLLLVGHDAFAAGAQKLLLSIGQRLKATMGVSVAFALMEGGPLLAEYERVGPVTVTADSEQLARLAGAGYAAALVNSAASSRALELLSGAGLPCTLLVHELPRLLRDRGLVAPLGRAVERASAIVFPGAYVQDRIAELVPLDPSKVHLIPQGLYAPVVPTDRAARRASLGLVSRTRLGVGLGYGDLRKGFDLFLHAWRAAQQFDPPLHMLWVGDLDPTVQSYMGPEIAAAEATGTFHHRPYSAEGAAWLAAADVLLLPSREDPLPSVVLEAMSAGVPVAAFEETGCIPDLLREHGAGLSVPLGDAAALAEAAHQLTLRTARSERRRLASCARTHFDFDRYVARLAGIACPSIARISAVVPNFNYARYLPDRLASIFSQSYPVAEIVVLDDASTDDSQAVTKRVAAEAGRSIAWVGSADNSGSVFEQWRKAAALACGEFVWIAEADDVAEPEFLATLVDALEAAPDAVMAFSDSQAIDAEGRVLWADHQAYYAEAGATMLRQDGVFGAPNVLESVLGERNLVLNASAVLFRRTALLAALDACAGELADYRMAGDWRLCAELLSHGGTVAYVAAPLNGHRRHDASVSAILTMDDHIGEVARMHRHMRKLIGPDPALRQGQKKALAAMRRALRARQKDAV